MTIIITVVIAIIIGWKWAVEISHMKDSDPDYKGDDFLNW